MTSVQTITEVITLPSIPQLQLAKYLFEHFSFTFFLICAIQGVSLDILSQFWFHLSTNIWWTLHGVSRVLYISLEDRLPNFIYDPDIYLLSQCAKNVSVYCALSIMRIAGVMETVTETDALPSRCSHTRD